MKDFWDERYRQSDFVYGDQPNVYFEEKLAELTPGKALFSAEGEGRNAVYAATQGFEVEAFDQSEEGKKKAMKLAEKKSMKINYTTVSADTISYEKESFDLLVMVFAHFPETFRRDLHRRFSSLVKKGGKIILEGFSKEHSKFQDENLNAGGPKNLEMLYDLEELKADFLDFDFQEAYISETVLNEGAYHQGKASVVRLFGTKK
ncbi:class I SAM-dependent methyltransferase [Chryseobacterium binzhouense]|uniref:class I SAM-dependent methyltransferase n=1 Tax=Chryseobacterium binzhouense TaxID=2593646 RepID=UPI00117E1BFC|nr:class I SAM-dependent methyltransferase [Chryseobacterium binzhouense]